MYKVRIILDTKKDVIRTITVNNAINLEELHQLIIKSFGFNGQEMASFYKTDDTWSQGEEIPLDNMSEFDETPSMSSYILDEIAPEINYKLIYVYDFFKLWSFYVEVIDITNESISEPKILLSVGEVPDQAPEKKFVAEKNDDDPFDDEFDALDALDPLDSFDEYDYT
jgi:hypothetical protein